MFSKRSYDNHHILRFSLGDVCPQPENSHQHLILNEKSALDIFDCVINLSATQFLLVRTIT